MKKSIRCTTHFHACDCREYEFEQLRKEIQEKDRFILSQEKDRQRTEAFWKEKLEKLQTENAAYIKQIQDKNLSLVELIEPLTRKLDEKDAGVERLKREKSIAIKSLDKWYEPYKGKWLISQNSQYLKAWQACSLSHAKKMQEKDAEIKRLQKENQEMREALNQAIKILDEGCIVYDQHVPSGASSFRVEADMFIKDASKCYKLSETSNSSKEGVV